MEKMIDETDAYYACRLCGAATTSAFAKRVLGRLNVKYFTCRSCGSLQTEPPYWLTESYKDYTLSALDTGAADRTLLNFALVTAVAKILREMARYSISGVATVCYAVFSETLGLIVGHTTSFPNHHTRRGLLSNLTKVLNSSRRSRSLSTL